MMNNEKRQASQSPRPIRSALFIAACFCAAAAAQAESAADIQPVASRIYPGASSSLILDVEQTGQGLVAVGERGHILRSQDGRSWNQVVAPVDSLLTAVSFVDQRHGWAVGHDAVILHTQDGGASWDLQHFEPKGAGPLLDVQFESKTHGYAVGAFGTCLQTTDGGQKWSAVDAPVIQDAGAHLYGITRYPGGRWLIVGEMGFLAASDDGSQWRGLKSPYHGSFYAAAPLGDSGAVLVGMRGNAFVSNDLDAGQWKTYQTDTKLSLTSVAQVSADEFLVTTLNRKLLKLTAAGQAMRLSLPEAVDQGATTGSFNDALLLGDELLIASDSGILHAPLQQTELSQLQNP